MKGAREATSPGKESVMDTKTYRCKGCGAPLPIDDEDDGMVTCDYCGTQNYIEELAEDDSPVYTTPPGSVREIVGRFMDMKGEKQSEFVLNLILFMFYTAFAIALVIKAIGGA